MGTLAAIADQKTCYAAISVSISADLQYRRTSSNFSDVAGDGGVLNNAYMWHTSENTFGFIEIWPF